MTSETRPLGRIWWLWGPIALAVLLALLANAAPQFYARWMEEEQGAVEMAQFFVLLAAFALAVRLLFRPEVRARRWLAGWVGLAAVCSFYVAGEEVSWGQHFLQWNTPEYWSEINKQDETNLHNVSSWFDQKPRAALELGVIIGGIFAPLLRWLRPGLLRGPLDLLAPTVVCLPSAVIAEIAGVTRRLDLHLFFRPSEVQELFFYLFVVLYLIVLGRRIRSAGAGR